MRILFTISPLAAHLAAMLPTIRAAAAAGHDVVVATGPDLATEIHRRGFPCWTAGPGGRQAWSEFAAHPASADELAQRKHLACVLYAQPAVARLRELLPRVHRWSPDLVIHDLTDAAGAEIAALTGAGQIVHGTGSQTNRQLAMLRLISTEFAAELMLPDRFADTLNAPFLDPTPAFVQPQAPLLFSHVHPVRPEVDPVRAGDRLPLRVQRFAYERTVLLNLGPSQRPDLLATALDVISRFEVNLLVETGPRIEVGMLGPVPMHVAAAQWMAPALTLPLCSAVVSYGGTGAVLGAVTHGLPQVVVPLGDEPRQNAIILNKSGAGIAVPCHPLVPGALRRALADVLANPAFARTAQLHRAAIAAMPTAAEVVQQLTETAVAA
jgi:UDP:flavonoid glycosyltransferase YjiC (YdhE family)